MNPTTINGVTLHTLGSAWKFGAEIPDFVKKGVEDTYLLAYDSEGYLIAWGPAKDRAHIERVLKVAY